MNDTVQGTGWAEKFESLFDMIPVLKGYRAKEKYRDADKILREYTVTRINVVKESLEDIKTQRVESGKLTFLDLLDKLTRKMDRIRDAHRFAAYGYSGYFDPQKIKEPELAKLYDYDRRILDAVEALILDAKFWAREDIVDPDLKAKIKAFDKRIDQLEDFVDLRKQAYHSV